MSYEEYREPRIKWVININQILLWLLGVVVAGGIIFGAVVAILSTNTETIDNRLENDCLAITYRENHPFDPDENLSGVYCRDE